ncbi:hypothetical protein H0H92_009066 [Tricholoma furcatifolium]|nr:hypothetical protein H0H92_009066 [Tricholoma furcatifolium]
MRPRYHSKRNRTIKGHDNDHYLGAQGEGLRSETYSHMHELSRHGDGFGAAAGSSYDLGREASSSRNRRHMEEWRREEDAERHVYMAGDGYHHHSGGHDEQTMLEAREPEGWLPAQYSGSRDDWSQRYDYSAYPPSSYAESSSRSTPILPHDGRGAPLDHWREADRQMLPPDDRHLSRESPNWRQEHRRDKNVQNFQSDSGWETHRRRRVWDEPAASWDEMPHGNDHAASERTWEPAPGWHPKGHDNHDYSEQYSRSAAPNAASASTSTKNTYSHSTTHSKGNYRRASNKAKRDWREDDSPLNNWQKREVPTSKVPLHKKQRRPSRSRSRSPVGSYQSRRSSQDRSRSISPASKRQRREETPPVSFNETFDRGRTSDWSNGRSSYSAPRSPFDRRSTGGRNKPATYPPVPRHEKDHSPASQRSYSGDRGRAILRPNSRYAKEASLSPRGSPNPRRRRSLSTASSVSSGRSPSQSPPGRARAIHRLPPADANTVMSPNHTSTTTSGKSGNPKNGKGNANGKHSKADRRKSASYIPPPHNDSMPPPDNIPLHSSHIPYPAETNYPITAHVPPRPTEPDKHEHPSVFSRFTPGKNNAGFKPISQTNSLLKKFFPSDEEELELPMENLASMDTSTRSMEGGYEIAHAPSYQRKVWPSPPPNPSPPRPSLTPQHQLEQDGSRTFANNAPIFVPAQALSNGHTSLTPSRIKSPSETARNDVPETPTPTMETQDELYNIISQVGEGTFGKVYKAQNTASKVYVALKRIRMESEKDGFPVTAMREIKLLQSLQHPNVVRLYEMVVATGSVYMVFEYMDHDLTGVLSQTQFTFTAAHLKSLCHQMLAGLAYLHHKGVIHRDIKGSNILVNNRGELKLGDFGLARFYQKRRRADYTNRVITLWYRPPELLFGATVYGPEVDMWSAGCIMLELFTKKPVFQGNDEIHQLDVIYKIFGTPTSERWAGVMDLPWYELVKPRETMPNRFRELFQKWLSSAGLDLAEQLLSYNPSERATASQAMEAAYFTEEEPKAALPVGLATLEGEWHELETKRERAKRKRKPDSVIAET